MLAMLKKMLITIMLACSLSLGQAEDIDDYENSLSQSVHHAQAQGKVLSAKTRNNQHVVKVLTPDGHVKTIKRRVDRKPNDRFVDGKSLRHNTELERHSIDEEIIDERPDDW